LAEIFENRRINYWSGAALTLLLAMLIGYALFGFLTSLLGALVFYLILSPAKQKLISKKWPSTLTVILLLLLSFALILGPAIFITYELISKINGYLSNNSQFLTETDLMIDNINAALGFNLLTENTLLELKNKVAGILPDLLQATGNMVGQILMMYLVLYFMLASPITLELLANKYLPLSMTSKGILGKELKSMTFSNVIGAPILAASQGIASWIAFIIIGVPDAGFWATMCGFFSFIPLVGPALIWFPTALYFLGTGKTGEGIGLMIYGTVVIGNIDNLLRFVLQKKFADIHPLITVLGVIIGLNWFGLPGIIFGPLLFSCFFALVKHYNRIWHLMRVFGINSKKKRITHP
jgi:predicted PurR-regulated permease PerM